MFPVQWILASEKEPRVGVAAWRHSSSQRSELYQVAVEVEEVRGLILTAHYSDSIIISSTKMFLKVGRQRPSSSSQPSPDTPMLGPTQCSMSRVTRRSGCSTTLSSALPTSLTAALFTSEPSTLGPSISALTPAWSPRHPRSVDCGPLLTMATSWLNTSTYGSTRLCVT